VIIADTSVWIEFLRNREPVHTRLNDLLERGMVLAAECVFGELLCGARSRQESDILETYWRNLPRIDEAGLWIEAGRLSSTRGFPARGIGLVDAAILALAARTGADIWTLDRRLQDAAGRSTSG
jgi:predicted nucleic acid-binding protein